VKGFSRYLSGFLVGTWVMASIVVAIAYGLCLGTAEAVAPHDHDTARSV
jgi:hypothetical protein